MRERPKWRTRIDGSIELDISRVKLLFDGNRYYMVFTVQELEAFITEAQEALIAACLEEPEDV